MKILKLLLAGNVLVMLLLYLNFNSCRHDPIIPPGGDPGNPNDTSHQLKPCDPNVVYFQKQILPIILSNCTMSGCHDGSAGSEGKILTNYTNILKSGYVNIIKPTGSKMYEAITETNPNDRMPQPPYPALTADQIALILKWMQQGARDIDCDGLCDSVNVKFSTNIKLTIQTYCQGCHSGTNPAKGLSLTNYTQISLSAKNPDGKFWGSINWLSGFIPMPYKSTKMPKCEISQIKKWIQDGAPNN